jgi:hypothetical protein
MRIMSSWSRLKSVLATAAVLGAVGVVSDFVGCSNNPNTVPVTSYGTVDPYLYTTYYPADVAYSSVYWADSWAYPTLYQTTTGAQTTTGNVVTTAGDAIRALARGAAVCTGQATVTPKMVTLPCTGGPASVLGGVTIAFNNCQTAGGGVLNGTVDVTATRTASSTTCSSTTMITLSHSTTVTNLSFMGADGRKLLIPSQTGMGMSTYAFGTAPATIALNYQGQLQTFATDGSTSSDHSYTAMNSFTFGGSTSSYTVNGTLNVVDNLLAGAATSITATNLQRTTSCCRPVAGTINITSTGAVGSHVVVFGSSCGEATLDGAVSATLPSCI